MQSCVLQARSLKRSAESSFGHTPSPLVGMITFRVRSWRPPPHAIVQNPQSVQLSRVQSRSHEPVLQDSSSWAVLHDSPPFLVLVMMERVRPRTPPSQSFVHFDHPDHMDISQSTGHFCWLHFLVVLNAGQTTPY